MAKMPPPTVFVPGVPGGGPIEFKEYSIRVEFLIPLWQCAVMGYATAGAISGICVTFATTVNVILSDVLWWTTWWNHFLNWGHIVFVLLGSFVFCISAIVRFGQEVLSPYFDAGWITKWINKRPQRRQQDTRSTNAFVVASTLGENTRNK